MTYDPVSINNYMTAFSEKMSGGAFICNADKERRIVYANKRLAEIFECESIEEFLDYVGGSVNGFFSVTSEEIVMKEAVFQNSTPENFAGYTFYNIKTKKSNIIRVVNHWKIDEDKDLGRLIYGLVFTHTIDNVSADFDSVTGLFGKRRFNKYISYENNKNNTDRKYAVAYLNIVNFKLLNVEKGTSEGDNCLKVIADILVKNFKSAYIARLSDDHFAILDIYENVMNNSSIVCNEFAEEYGSQYNVYIKFGIYGFMYSPEFDSEDALSRAKIACDFIKRDYNSNIVEYSKNIEDSIKLREYVVRKLDEAIEKEWIRVYFQPVIRSITGQMSSVESLVRWIDPEVGFLPPDHFISVLEDEKCIHKLDSFIVRRVCQYIRERVDSGEPAIPVSVNFSQMDFVMCDMLEVVEKAVEEYDIPRDYLHIEITESMIAADEERMHEIISGFKKAGYEVWMDDFGSGYSSLTVLKDYSFDTLKMDMRFLRPFNEKSKSIMRAVITMAKEIGMKTLAEGVETKEQLDFLRECGCGMIQGYYYGKPEPIDDMFRHIADKGITIEKRKWRHFYETAGFCAQFTDSPLEIIEDDGKNFRTLFMNNSYKKQIFSSDISTDEVDSKIYKTASPLVQKYRDFANQIEKTGEEETFYYTSNGMYLRLIARSVAECEGHHIIKASITNISLDAHRLDTERLDTKARQLNLLFETVLLVKLNENTVTPIFGGFKYLKNVTAKDNDLQKGILLIENDVVHPTERLRCHEFLLSADLKERVEKTGIGYISDVFRAKQSDGNYRWREFFIMMIPGTAGNEYLFCMKNHTPRPELAGNESKEKNNPDVSSIKDAAEIKPNETISAADTAKPVKKSDILGVDNSIKALESYGKEIDFKSIWQNLMWNSSMKVFWKDRDCRFIGVSKSFMDYFGFTSDEEVIGKTDDELKIHVDNESFNRIEQDVLNTGNKAYNTHGQCLVKGVTHEIFYDVIPLYMRDTIIGTIGVFRDSEEVRRMIDSQINEMKRDPVTGLMNAHAFVDGLIDYAIKYNEDGTDYGIIVLNNLKYDRILSTYNKDFGNKVLNRIAQSVIEKTDKGCIVARPKDSIFAVLSRINDADEFRRMASNIEENVRSITEVDGNSITMKIRIASKIRSESDVTDERFYEKNLKEVLK